MAKHYNTTEAVFFWIYFAASETMYDGTVYVKEKELECWPMPNVMATVEYR